MTSWFMIFTMSETAGLLADWVKKPRVPSSWLHLPGVKHAVLLGLAYAAIHYSVSQFSYMLCHVLLKLASFQCVL